MLMLEIMPGTSPTKAYSGTTGQRFLLPERRELDSEATHGHKVCRTGEYPDGTLGEVFIDIAKEELPGVLGCSL